MQETFQPEEAASARPRSSQGMPSDPIFAGWAGAAGQI
jgi:hypothetical protein